MIHDVCPATPPYRHLAALVKAVDAENWGHGKLHYRIAEAWNRLHECPACMAAIGKGSE